MVGGKSSKTSNRFFCPDLMVGERTVILSICLVEERQTLACHVGLWIE